MNLAVPFLFKTIGIIFCLCWVLLAGSTYAQGLRFADTYPVNNSDSVERWVAQHQELSQDRLKSLIRLERIYSWNFLNKLGSHLPEIKRYADSQKSGIARAAYDYILAWKHLREDRRNQTALYANLALNEFVRLGDESGQLHAYSLLVMINSTSIGFKVASSNKRSQSYLGNMENSLARTNDGHDFLTLQLTYTRYQYGQGQIGSKGDTLLKIVEKAIERINQNQAYSYAAYRFRRQKAICYYLLGQSMRSYEQNRQILAQLRPDQFLEKAYTQYNLVLDCYLLKRTEEGIALCQQALALFSKYQPSNYGPLSNMYTKYRALLQQKGDYAGADLLSDSIRVISNLITTAQNDKKMLELEARYETERKQQQIHYLETMQKQTRQWLIIAIVGLLIVGALSYKLFRTNRQLTKLTEAREHFFGIIAHDLRRPLFAFQGMNELVSYNLQKQNYGAIEQLSKAIDEAGFSIQSMLDNLLKWALSQREALPYNPQKLYVHPKLDEVARVFRGLPSKHPLHFSISCPDSLQVYVDPNGLELILRNLLANAYKAMDTLTGYIRLEAEAYDDAQVIIRISDSGIGMSSETLLAVQKALRYPFDVHGDEARLGLGLVLVSQFTAKNMGRITVESSLGAGTSFTLVFPVDKPATKSKVPLPRLVHLTDKRVVHLF
ncbi:MULTISPECIES: HAMP domain-containing sensor histidine kinase [unclassified Spirosoma]|uniref:sensor histidine kinase n=1 Tax=unclassified Spirosoma TaxID=2621999 RepID=UPI0009606AA9|nr:MULTISPECIES: HAMP domain-containing sensor histidine kinase [unclassified Spirosoma]MBN8826850.1 HAMP domain-containing histidine kinase [Spirosoma sp.]OJW80334.1 MAG: hypothetical protein BGO59_33075 [Spirosoma sp. 48-14]